MRPFLCQLKQALCVKEWKIVATLIDVLDTAVKIGLGASISAVATYWHSKYRDKADSAKEYEKRHRSLLEQVADQAEQLNHAYLKYWALIIEWVRYENNKKEWPEDRRSELEETKTELFTAFGSLTSAESKLLLVGENEAYLKLRELGEAVVQFRRTCYVDKKSLTEEEIDIKKSEIQKLREDLYQLLSSTYQANFT
jgi:predicted transcriptional regulator